MNFWSVKNVKKYYNFKYVLSAVKKFYAMLHLKYYKSTTLNTFIFAIIGFTITDGECFENCFLSLKQL